MAETTKTLFAVARGTTVLTDYRPSVAGARSDLAAIESSMRQSFLEPDVQLVTIEQTTSYSAPVPYVEQPVTDEQPAPTEQAPAEPEQAATGEAEHVEDAHDESAL